MWKWMTFVGNGSSRALVKASALAAVGVCGGLGAGCGSSSHTSVVYERYEPVHEPPPAVVVEDVRYERVAPPRVVHERVDVAPRHHEEYVRGRRVVVREVERDRREHHRPSERHGSTTVSAEVEVR